MVKTETAPRAGRCAYPTDTIRGKCWRKTYRHCAIYKDGVIVKRVFLCWWHLKKPIDKLVDVRGEVL